MGAGSWHQQNRRNLEKSQTLNGCHPKAQNQKAVAPPKDAEAWHVALELLAAMEAGELEPTAAWPATMLENRVDGEYRSLKHL